MHSATLLLAALSAGQALAGPAHARFHRHAHAKRVDYDTSNVDWKAMDWNDILPESAWAEAYSKGLATSTEAAAVAVAAPTTATAAPQTTTAAPVTTTAAPAVAKVAAPSSSSASSSDSSDLVSDVLSEALSAFSFLKPVANGISSLANMADAQTGTSDGTLGNYGSPNCHNMMEVGSIDGHDLTLSLENTSGEDMLVAFWNNAFNGTPNQGQCLASSTPCMTISIPAGATKHAAFGAWSLGGWAQATTETSSCGMFNQVMGEFHFVPGSSGYDYSSIPSTSGSNYDMSISAAEGDCVSDASQNSWKGQDNNPENPVQVGSGSCWLPAQTAHLTAKMGGRI